MDFADNQWFLGPFSPVGFSLKYYLTILLLATSISAQSGDAGTVSILNAPNFSSQRDCAQQCFGGSCGVCHDLAGSLDCPIPYLNGCFCRSDLTSSALSILSSCVWFDCQYNSVDLETALGIYCLDPCAEAFLAICCRAVYS
jgi:hypothetical protein